MSDKLSAANVHRTRPPHPVSHPEPQGATAMGHSVPAGRWGLAMQSSESPCERDSPRGLCSTKPSGSCPLKRLLGQWFLVFLDIWTF